jgi:hypothetical protein
MRTGPLSLAVARRAPRARPHCVLTCVLSAVTKPAHPGVSCPHHPALGMTLGPLSLSTCASLLASHQACLSRPPSCMSCTPLCPHGFYKVGPAACSVPRGPFPEAIGTRPSGALLEEAFSAAVDPGLAILTRLTPVSHWDDWPGQPSPRAVRNWATHPACPYRACAGQPRAKPHPLPAPPSCSRASRWPLHQTLYSSPPPIC